MCVAVDLCQAGSIQLDKSSSPHSEQWVFPDMQEGLCTRGECSAVALGAVISQLNSCEAGCPVTECVWLLGTAAAGPFPPSTVSSGCFLGCRRVCA